MARIIFINAIHIPPRFYSTEIRIPRRKLKASLTPLRKTVAHYRAAGNSCISSTCGMWPRALRCGLVRSERSPTDVSQTSGLHVPAAPGYHHSMNALFRE